MMIRARLMGLLVTLVVLLGIGQTRVAAATMGTAFTYQGRFTDGSSPANGDFDFQFTLFAAATDGNQVGDPLTKTAVDVNDGYFTTTLDFGPGVFGGDARWLQIAVRPAGQGSYTTLTPRHELTPTPYALHASYTGPENYLAKFTAGGMASSLLYESGGNVGLGTASPGAKLDIHGDFKVGSNDLYVDTSGTGIAVGIGSAPSSTSTMLSYLQLGANSGLQANTAAGPYVFLMQNTRIDVGGNWRYGADGYASYYSQYAGEHQFYTAASGIANGIPSWGNAKVVIGNDGKVGIGTTPANRLHVNSGTANNVALFESTDPGAVILLKDNNTTGGGEAIARGGDVLDLRTNDTPRLTILGTSGYVGIGTGAPTQMLDVSGTVRCVSLVQTSDVQLKTDIQPLGTVLDKLVQVRAVSFRWNEKAQSLGAKTDTRQIGVLAQELERVFPELVVTPEPTTVDKLFANYPEEMLTAEFRQRLQEDAEKTQYKAVRYSELTAVLLEAVKELQAQNRALEQRIQALETKVK